MAELTAYELEREARIARNKRIMEALGLHSFDLEAVALRNKAEAGGDKKAKGVKRRALDAEPTAPTRRSRRLQGGEDGDGETLRGLDDDEVPARDDSELAALHEAEAAAWDARHAGRQQRATIVGTASYNHTLMRVRTMTEPALLRRVAAIERAKGAHAVIKMRMFARVAFLEGYDAVADAATEALTRLIEVLGDMPDAPLDGTE